MSPTYDQALPLEPHELHELTAALGERTLPATLGFLTAIVSVPEPIPTEAWLGELVGPAIDREPAQAERLAGYLGRLLQHVAKTMLEDEVESLLPELTHSAGLKDFCGGYVDVLDQLELAHESEEVLGDMFALEYLAARVSDEELREVLEEGLTAEQFSAAVTEDLPNLLASLHEVWGPARRRAMTVRREAPKVGRNDACPCGSGKKHKKCCGAALS